MYQCTPIWFEYKSAGTHVSVFVYLMRGKFDSRLAWPFKGGITIQLFSHSNDLGYHEKTVLFDASTGNSGKRVISGERANTGQGIHQFIVHTVVESFKRRFIVDDCLTFRVNIEH